MVIVLSVLGLPSGSHTIHSRWVRLWLGRSPRFPEPAFHCTSPARAATIRAKGFAVGTRGKFGAGVYLTADKPDHYYGPDVVRVAVKLKNPIDTTMPEGHVELREVTYEAEERVRALPRFDDPTDREDAVGDIMRTELLSRGYDGVVLDDGTGDRGEMTIYDLSSIRVVRDLDR